MRRDNFNQYMSGKYGAKGRRSIRFASRLDELDILLGVKDISEIDEEDIEYLSEKQLEELEKMKERRGHLKNIQVEEE